MEAFTSFFESSSSSRNFASLKNLHQISPVVQSHLKQVYVTLCWALVATAVGSYLDILLNVGGVLTMLATLGCIMWVQSTPPREEKKRVRLLMATAVFQGATMGPLIKMVLHVDPSILVSAFVGCALAFGSFSIAAMLARRREYLFLGSFLSASISILTWVNFASFIFGGSASIYKFQLYFGLLVFVGYIIFDTQAIIEKAHLGDLDYVNHALTLFTDFIAVFVRILVIMLKNAEEKEKKKKKGRNGN